MIQQKTHRPLLGHAKALTLGLVLAALMSMALAAKTAHAAGLTFAVNTTFSDAGDLNVGDGVCDAFDFQGPQCTLRAAIQEANHPNNPGADTINFDIPTNFLSPKVQTIFPASELPTITEAVTIDGYTQGGSTPNPDDDATENTQTAGTNANLLVELDGSNAGSSADGLSIEADNVTVRGLVINAFSSAGIDVRGSANKVEGNFIGTDAPGTSAGPGNDHGVFVANGQDNIVGGASPAARNLISGNDREGVQLQGTAPLFSIANKVQGNLIGTGKSGTTPLGNGGAGVSVLQTPFNVIGGGAAEANTIAFNAQQGVAIRATDNGGSTNNRIQSNSIFSNGALGVDLNGDGPTANDPKDPDLGENGLQNKPVLTSAVTSGATTTIKGKLNSTPDTRFLVELFSNPSGEDEGKKPLGRKLVTTNANGNVSFTFTPSRTVSAGRNVTATATDRGLNTSEFSVPHTVVAS